MLPGKKIEPQEMLEMVRRRIWLIAIPPAVTLLAAVVYSSTLPNLYQSDMLIAIDPQKVPDTFVRSTVTLATDRRVDAITVQVLSRTRLQQLIETLDLYPVERQTMAVDEVVMKMRNNISVTLERPRPVWGVPPTPTAFHVLFTYPDPAQAAQVTQQLGSLFVQQNVDDRTSQAGSTNRFLETHLQTSRKELEAQEGRLEAFRQRYGQELPSQMQSNMQSLQNAQLQAQSLVESIARDRDRRMMLDRLYREQAAEPAAPRLQTQGEPIATGSVREQLSTAQANLAALLRRYRADHPDIGRARRLVAELEARVAAEPSAETRTTNGSMTPVVSAGDPARRESLRQMTAEIESLDRQMSFKESEERRVRQEISEYQRRLEAVPGLESEWVKLTRDYETRQAAYRELLSKSTAAQVAADLESENIGERFRIVDPATVPVRPLQSMRIRYNAGGFLVGLIIGLMAAAFLEIRDRSFKTGGDVVDVLGLPVLATVPRVETAAEKRRGQRRRLGFSLAGATCLVAAGFLVWNLKLWNSLI